MLNRFLVIIGIVIAFAACKTKKQVVVNRTGTGVKATSDAEAKIASIQARQLAFTTFSGKAKTNLSINGKDNDVTLNIRISRDKKIWVSVTAILGVEVARAMITPDSILILNKFEGMYLRKPFNYIHKFTGPNVNYASIQALLTGNVLPQVLNDSTAFTVIAPNLQASGTLDDIAYKLIFGPDLRVTQTNLVNAGAQQNLQVGNAEFIIADEHTLPSQIDIASVVKKQKIQVNLHYNKVEFDKQLDFPFTIPGHYKPAAD